MNSSLCRMLQNRNTVRNGNEKLPGRVTISGLISSLIRRFPFMGDQLIVCHADQVIDDSTLIRIAWRKPIRILISCGRPAMRMSMTILSLRRMSEMSALRSALCSSVWIVMMMTRIIGWRCIRSSDEKACRASLLLEEVRQGLMRLKD